MLGKTNNSRSDQEDKSSKETKNEIGGLEKYGSQGSRKLREQNDPQSQIP